MFIFCFNSLHFMEICAIDDWYFCEFNFKIKEKIDAIHEKSQQKVYGSILNFMQLIYWVQ